MTNRDPYDHRRRAGVGWRPGAIVALAVAGILVIGAFLYAMYNPSAHTGGAGPSTSTSAPNTTGQGGRAGAPSGDAR